jgi:CheY-like chemotaxis protein
MSPIYHILAVDNDKVLVNMLSSELTEKGYIVTSAYDGDEAIKIVEALNIDLIILDILMPKLGGFAVLKFVKEKYPSIKVIMLTGYNDMQNAVESKKLGADDFIGKPCDLSEIFISMDKLLPVNAIAS